MRILIRTWTRQGGERSAADRLVEVERVRIGRGTDQDIELPDLKIPLSHSRIVRSGSNAMFVCKPGAHAKVNGEVVLEHKLRGGDEIEIGRYKLTVMPPEPGADLLIEIEELISARDEKAERLSKLKTRLDQVMPSRRLMSWLLFAFVLLSTLALPAWLRFSDNRLVKTAAPAWPRDHVWVPGPSSRSHAYFQNDCGKCHQQAFVPVRNEACLECHQDTRHHADDERWARMSIFSQARCEDCHREHQGQMALVDRHDALCTDCHATPSAKFAGIKLEPATDFSGHHPAFKPRVARYDGVSRTFSWIEVSQDNPQELHEQTNLKYPHDVHLDPKGVKSPDGLKLMACADCHEVDSSGVSFKPVNMEKHCASCHRLDFDPEDPSRVVPHGRPAQVVQAIRDYYARAALAGGITAPGAPMVVQLRRKPGEQLDQAGARAALAWADQRARLVVDETFDKRVCSYCHTVERRRDPDLPWAIAPVNLEERALAHAEFSHDAHKGEKCESCHAAKRSKHSEDVLLPEIKRCRDCHGDPDTGAKIPSNCTECHGYHIAKGEWPRSGGDSMSAPAAMNARPAMAGQDDQIRTTATPGMATAKSANEALPVTIGATPAPGAKE
jgi:predicted CXXCH cytochrome family protein